MVASICGRSDYVSICDIWTIIFFEEFGCFGGFI